MNSFLFILGFLWQLIYAFARDVLEEYGGATGAHNTCLYAHMLENVLMGLIAMYSLTIYVIT